MYNGYIIVSNQLRFLRKQNFIILYNYIILYYNH